MHPPKICLYRNRHRVKAFPTHRLTRRPEKNVFPATAMLSYSPYLSLSLFLPRAKIRATGRIPPKPSYTLSASNVFIHHEGSAAARIDALRDFRKQPGLSLSLSSTPVKIDCLRRENSNRKNTPRFPRSFGSAEREAIFVSGYPTPRFISLLGEVWSEVNAFGASWYVSVYR